MVKIKVYICVIILISILSGCLYRHDGMMYLSFKFNTHKTDFIALENQFSPDNIDKIDDHRIAVRTAFEHATGVTALQMSFNPLSKLWKCNHIDIMTGSKRSSGYIYYADEGILDTLIYYANQLPSIDPSIHVKVKKLSEHWMCYNSSEEMPIAILVRNIFNWSD